MAGSRQRSTIEDRIAKAQDKVVTAKDKYDAAVNEFKELIAKRDAIQQEELMELIMKSSKTYEEIKSFLMEGIEDDIQLKKRSRRKKEERDA